MVKLWFALIFFLSAALSSQDSAFSLDEVQRHSTPSDCWILIDRNVYDLSSYLSEHATKHEYNLSKWCGKDASKAWKDKDGKDKPHSRKAEILLRKYRIGVLAG